MVNDDMTEFVILNSRSDVPIKAHRTRELPFYLIDILTGVSAHIPDLVHCVFATDCESVALYDHALTHSGPYPLISH